MLKKFGLIPAALALLSCSSQPSAPRAPFQEKTLSTGNRITVERIAEFRDRFAYGERREILIIKDAKTGKEFIGVSGVGITETSRVPHGKTTTEVEN